MCEVFPNILTITNNRENIWKHFYARPDLVRVIDSSADLGKKPITAAEEEFINSVILHINSAYYAMRDVKVVKLEGLRWDVGAFMSLPLPRAVWEKTKKFQNVDSLPLSRSAGPEEICLKANQPVLSSQRFIVIRAIARKLRCD